MWNEQKARRFEGLRKRTTSLSDADRAELAELTRELEGVETAFMDNDTKRKIDQLTTPKGGDQRPPRWNVVSVCMAFVGFVVGFGCFSIFIEHWRGVVVHWAIGVWVACCFLGIASAIISLVRAERLWGITALGFLLNLPIFGLVVFWLWNVGR